MRNKIILVLLSVIFLSLTTRASHYAGGDFQIRWIGGNDYTITFNFYRDCSGIDEPLTADIIISSSCMNDTISLPKLPPVTGTEITSICPSAYSTCSGGTLYGIKKYVYEGTVTLMPCADYVISFTGCCRNPDNTLFNSTSDNWFIPIEFNNQAAPGNSTPYFGNLPIMVIFNGHDYCYNHGVLDPDNDSVTYKLIVPRDSYNIPVTFVLPYNEQQFLASNPPIENDTLTGDICMHPTTNLVAVFAAEVTEWRVVSGIPTIISKIVRDMQVEVISASFSLPTLAGINPAATHYDPNDSTYIWYCMAGDTVDFNIYPYDSIPTANLTMAWNHGISDGNFTVTQNATPNCLGHFNWVATSSYIPNAPRCFTVNIKDDNCPYFGEQTFSYCFVINGLNMVLSPSNDTILMPGQSYDLFAHAPDANVIHWYVDGVQTAKANDTIFHVNADLLGTGQHVISCRVYNTSAPSRVGFEYVRVQVGYAGIERIESKEISIHPNPSDGIINISVGNIINDICFDVYDANGIRVSSGILKNKGQGSYQIDLSNYSNGLYFVKFWNNELLDVRKIIIE
jgi:hypothetical protein